MLTFKQLEDAIFFIPSKRCFCYGGVLHKDADGFCKNTEELIHVCSNNSINTVIYTVCSKCVEECTSSYIKELYFLTEKEVFTFKVIHGL